MEFGAERGGDSRRDLGYLCAEVRAHGCACDGKQRSSSLQLAEDDLVLCAGTLEATPILERLEPARAAGFAGISVFTTDILAAAREGVSTAELRERIEAAGLAITDVDPLAKWFEAAVDGGGLLVMGMDEALEAAHELGARSINAVVFPASPPTRDELVESFAVLCDRAAEFDLQVMIEFIPFTPMRSLQDALALVEAADRRNGGIMLDVWHLYRSGGSALDVERAASRIFGVQLNDAPEAVPDNLVEETMHARRLPGEGDAGVPQIIRALRTGGSKAPLGVEVFSKELRSLSPFRAAQLAYRAARACVEQSR